MKSDYRTPFFGAVLGCFDKLCVPGLLAVTVMRVGVLKDIHPRKPRFFYLILVELFLTFN